MSLYKEKIESKSCDHKKAKVRKWMKNQMNRFIRRKKIDVEDCGGKVGRKPTHGWEY